MASPTTDFENADGASRRPDPPSDQRESRLVDGLSAIPSGVAAPAFAGAMMGRQVLGAIPVERRVLVFASVEVAGNPWLEGRTVAEAFRPGAWRVLALETAAPDERPPDLTVPRPRDAEGDPGGLVWNLHSGYVLHSQDRVVLAATRQGLAELLGRGTAPVPDSPAP